MESNQAEQKREKRIMQCENRCREFSDSIKCNNICIKGVLEEEKRKGAEVFETMISEFSPE